MLPQDLGVQNLFFLSWNKFIRKPFSELILYKGLPRSNFGKSLIPYSFNSNGKKKSQFYLAELYTGARDRWTCHINDESSAFSIRWGRCQIRPWDMSVLEDVQRKCRISKWPQQILTVGFSLSSMRRHISQFFCCTVSFRLIFLYHFKVDSTVCIQFFILNILFNSYSFFLYL